MVRYCSLLIVFAVFFAVGCKSGGGVPINAPNATSVTPTTGVAETSVKFNAAVSGGTPTLYAWSFGGGTVPDTTTIASPNVMLGAAGTYQCNVTVSNDGGSDTFNFTLTVSAAVDVDELVESGMEDLLAGDGNAAVASFEEALAADPDNPEANFGMAYVDLMREANSIVAFLSEENELVFRNVASLPLSAIPMPIFQGEGVLDMGSLISGEKGTSAYYDDMPIDDMTFEELRLEIVAVIAALDDIVAGLENAITNAPDDWSFEVPEDWEDPAAGSITFIKADLLVLVGTLDFLMANLHFAVAYTTPSLGLSNAWGSLGVTGYFEEDVVDLNTDGFIDLSELATSMGLASEDGLLADDGRSHLDQTASYFRQALLNVIDAGDRYIALDALVGHWAFDLSQADADDFATDWASYARAYAQDFADAFSGTTTIEISSALMADYPQLADDPGADWSLEINFAAFFANLPDDLRDFPIRLQQDEWGDVFVPSEVDAAFSDTTMLGLFPGGLSQENYDRFFMGE